MKFMPVDAATFKTLGNGFAADKNQLYLAGLVVPDLHPDNFRMLGDGFVRSGDDVYFFAPQESAFYFDAQTFEPMGSVDPQELNGGLVCRGVADSFEVLSYGWARTNEQVFNRHQLLKKADPASFQVLNASYAKDENSVFFEEYRLGKADAASFTPLNTRFARDNQAVYWDDARMGKVNPEAFEVLREEDESVYARDESCLFDANGHRKFKTPDVASLRFLGSHWAIDDKGVLDLLEGCKRVKGLNPETFRVYDNDYAMDDKTVFFVRIKTGLSPNGFERIADTPYVISEGRLYFEYFGKHRLLADLSETPWEYLGDGFIRVGDKLLRGDQEFLVNDVATTEILPFGHLSDGHFLYYGDRKIKLNRHPQSLGYGYYRVGEKVFFNGHQLKKADAASFEVIEPAAVAECDQPLIKVIWARDKQRVYQCHQPRKGLDPDSFAHVDPWLYKDSQQVYFQDKSIPSAHPGSFEKLSDGYYKDRERAYWFNGFTLSPKLFRVGVE